MKVFEFDDSGLMPALGLGTLNVDPGIVASTVRDAIRVGYRHFDCAAVYQNEPGIGQAFSAAFKASEVDRESLWVTSKLWSSEHARADVIPALKQSLQDLQLDYLDLYLIHWPVVLQQGVIFPEQASEFRTLAEVPLEETWAAMEEARQLGLCRNIGVSNFNIPKLTGLIDQSSIQPAVNQVELHPYLPQWDLMDYCRQQGIVMTAYSPLGSGGRPEQFRKPGAPVLIKDSDICRIARRHGVSPGQVLIAWAIQRGTSVIPKTSNPERLRENYAAASLQLDTADMEEIAANDTEYRIVDGSFWAGPGSTYGPAYLWDQ